VLGLVCGGVDCFRELLDALENMCDVRLEANLALGVLDELTGKIIPLPIKQGEEVLPMCPVAQRG